MCRCGYRCTRSREHRSGRGSVSLPLNLPQQCPRVSKVAHFQLNVQCNRTHIGGAGVGKMGSYRKDNREGKHYPSCISGSKSSRRLRLLDTIARLIRTQLLGYHSVTRLALFRLLLLFLRRYTSPLALAFRQPLGCKAERMRKVHQRL